MKKTIKVFLNKAFDIREGEYRTALLMQLNIFLLISTLLIVKPNITALFLSKFGAEQLPQAFVWIAIAALLISTLYSRLLTRIPFNRIIERTQMLSFATLFLFLVLLRLNILESGVLYLFYIWISIFALLSSSQFWILANMVYNVREAKRLFSFIGSGAIAGGIFGGYLTSVLAPLIGSENVLFVSAFLLLLCIPVTRLIWLENISSLSIYRRRKRMKDFGEHPLKTIIKSRHLIYLAGIIGIGVLVAKFVDYQFNDIAHATITDPDELAAFFGFWFSNLNLLSLIIQLFITPRVVGVWGVGTSLLFLPFGILFGAVMFLLFPVLWAAILVKSADGSLKQSINKSATELLGLPIPFEIKSRTKTFIDLVIDSLATGIAGLILLVFINGLGLTSWSLSIVIIVLIILWISLADRVRAEYLAAFKLKFEEPFTDSNNQSPPSQQSLLQGIETVLENGSEDQQLQMLANIREINNEHLFDSVRHLLDHSSAAVRAEAIQTLYQFRQKKIIDQIRPFIFDPDQEVKLAAFEYLFEYSEQDISGTLEGYLDHENRQVANAALISLAIETRNNQTLKDQYQLEQRVREKIHRFESGSDPRSQKDDQLLLLEILRYANIPELNHYIQTSLRNEDPDIVRSAIISASGTLDPEFIEPLIGILADKRFRSSAQEALITYGVPIIDRLMRVIDEKKYPLAILRAIPAIVEHFDSQQAVNDLFKLLDNDDPKLRSNAIRSLNHLKVESPDLKFHKKKVAKRILREGKLYLETLSVMYAQIIINFKKQKNNADEYQRRQEKARQNLIELLEERLDHNLERIFRLLDLKYPTEDIILAYKGIRSNKPEQRINAIEFLDNLLEPDLKRVLIPIVETTILDSVSEEAVRSLSLDIPTEKECFELLLAGNDQHIKSAVFQLISELHDKSYIPMIKNYKDSDNVNIQTFASEALEKLSNS